MSPERSDLRPAPSLLSTRNRKYTRPCAQLSHRDVRVSTEHCRRQSRSGSAPRRADRRPGRIHASTPGCARTARRSPQRRSSMKAVVSASATVAARHARPLAPARRSLGLRGRGTATHDAQPPAHAARRCADRRCDRPCARPTRPSAVWRTESRASTRDASRGSLSVNGQPPMSGRRLEREDRAEASVHERSLEAPVLEQLRHQIDRVALADAAEIDLHAASCSRARRARRGRSRAMAARCRSRRRTRRRSARTCAARSRGTRASSGVTRVCSPAASWLMRVMSLFGWNRLSSRSSRSTRSKAACAACAAHCSSGWTA